MIRSVVKFSFQVLLWIVYAAYQAEGLNALFLLMPSKFIVPTLRKYGARIGERVQIHSPLIIHNASAEPGKHYAHLVIRDDCYFGREVFFDLKDEIRIEECVTVSMRVTFITHTDVGKSPVAQRMPPSCAPIVLQRGAYVGAGAMILQGVEIGEEAVIGAGALVNQSVAGRAAYGGVPAHMLSAPTNLTPG